MLVFSLAKIVRRAMIRRLEQESTGLIPALSKCFSLFGYRVVGRYNQSTIAWRSRIQIERKLSSAVLPGQITNSKS